MLKINAERGLGIADDLVAVNFKAKTPVIQLHRAFGIIPSSERRKKIGKPLAGVPKERRLFLRYFYPMELEDDIRSDWDVCIGYMDGVKNVSIASNLLFRTVFRRSYLFYQFFEPLGIRDYDSLNPV